MPRGDSCLAQVQNIPLPCPIVQMPSRASGGTPRSSTSGNELPVITAARCPGGIVSIQYSLVSMPTEVYPRPLIGSLVPGG